jgi:hypothetical protein
MLAEMVGEIPPYPRTAGKPFNKLADHRDAIPSSAFKPYWTKALDELMVAYNQICAYCCFRIHPVTGARSVDHFAPKSRDWQYVYEWHNYRLASSLLNARKREFSDLVDPFEVEESWFRLELVGFQVTSSPDLEPAIRERISTTITRLGLNDAIFRNARERDAENYWQAQISLPILEEESPFVAFELRRQARLRPGDGI